MRTFMPRMRYTHLAYFLGLMALLLHHVWMAWTETFNQWRYLNPGLTEVFRTFPLEVWAAGSFLVVILLLLGMYVRWPFALAGLAIGLFLTILRAYYVEVGGSPGAGLGAWGTIAFLHITMLIGPSRPLAGVVKE